MQKRKEDKDKRLGIVGTTIFHVIVFIFLMIFGLTTIPEEEEGVLVNLGDSRVGWGKQEPKKAVAASSPKSVTPPPPASVQKKVEPTKEQIKTQDYDEAPEVKSEEQKKKEEADRQKRLEERKKREEQQRLKRKEDERQRELKEEKRRKEEAERKRQREIDRQKKAISSNVSNAFGKSTGSSTSEGVNKGRGNQGYVTGDPNSKNYSGTGRGTKGNGFQLKGRSLKGALPEPIFKGNEAGIVVVKIKVDRNGKVVSAEYTLRGSTLQEAQFKTAAKTAALEARFNADPDAPAYVEGTITYHFELK